MKSNYGTLVFFLINSFCINVGYNILTSVSYNDSLIDIIVGSIFIILFLLIILRIRNYYKKDIIDIICSYKYLKYPLLIFLLFILVVSNIYSINRVTDFIQFYTLKEVNYFTISISLILTSIYLVKKGLITISRVSEVFIYIYIFIFILGFIGLSNYININNIKPLLTSSFNNHIKTSFNFFKFSILPIFLVLGLKPNNKKDTKNIIIFSSLSLIMIFLQLILIVSVLGINLTNVYINPDIMIYKKIAFLNILERVEIFMSFNQILNSIFIITINFYIIKKIITVLIKKRKDTTLLVLIALFFIFLVNSLSITISYYDLINILLLGLCIFLIIKNFFDSYIHY